MEFFSNHLSFFFHLITLLSSCQIHARDTQFFNKIPTNNNGHIEKETKVVVTQNNDQEPNFMPENENAYGVYGQLPPSTPTPNTNLIPNNKYLRKNYNPVAYVTVPRDNTDDDNNNNNSHRYNSGSSDDHYYRGDNTYDNDNNNNNNNNEYYISGNTYNHYYRGDSTYDNNDDNNNNYQYHNADRAGSKVTISSIEPSLNGDNHEYYYINNHQEQSPNTYENSREFANFYVANNELSNNNYNNFVNYENEEEFQDEEHMP